MKLLNDVLGNPAALEAFQNGATIYAAHELTSDIDSQFERKIKETLQAIELADRLSNKTKLFYRELYDDLKIIRLIASKINDFRIQREQNDDEF